MHATALVIVLYHPEEPEKFNRLAASLPSASVVLVDNTPGADFSATFEALPNVAYVALGENRGIAAAQNVGVEEARRSGAERIVFFDQDSEVDASLVERLVEAHAKLKADVDANAFVLGPVLEDPYGGRRVQRGFEKRMEAFVENDLIASSGSVALLSDIAKVGPLWERLFIADVDYEWIWRARSMGMKSYQATGIRMVHSIGERSAYLFGRKLGLSSPVRYRYQFRNWFLLLRKRYVPFGWRLRELRNLLFSVCYIAVRGPRRLETLRCAARGVREGIFEK